MRRETMAQRDRLVVVTRQARLGLDVVAVP